MGATLTNSARNSTLYGMTPGGGSKRHYGNVFSLTVSGANNLNYTLAAAVQSGSATLGAITSGTGSLAPAASQSCTVSATSTKLGVTTISFTGSDPNSSNLSQTTTATLTVLDHAAAAFANGGTVLNLNFGTLQLGSGTRDLQFQIENLPAAYRAGLALESVMALSDPGGVFSTDAAPFADLACRPDERAHSICSSIRRKLGNFSGQYQFNLSDEQDLSGWAGGQTLTLNVTADVVPEPSALALLGADLVRRCLRFASLSVTASTDAGSEASPTVICRHALPCPENRGLHRHFDRPAPRRRDSRLGAWCAIGLPAINPIALYDRSPPPFSRLPQERRFDSRIQENSTCSMPRFNVAGDMARKSTKGRPIR